MNDDILEKLSKKQLLQAIKDYLNKVEYGNFEKFVSKPNNIKHKKESEKFKNEKYIEYFQKKI